MSYWVDAVTTATETTYLIIAAHGRGSKSTYDRE
jgi:hypothetical protein